MAGVSEGAMETEDAAALPADDTEQESDENVDVPSWWRQLLPLVWDVGLPTGAYYLVRASGESPYLSLLAGTVVAGLRVGYVAVSSRKFDGFAAFLLTVFGVGLALAFVTGDARFLLAKDSVTTGVAGLIFLGTCLFGRPLCFYAAGRMLARTPGKRRHWESLWASSKEFRHLMLVMTLVWGFGQLAEAVVRLPLVYLLPIDVMAGLSSAMQIAAYVLLTLWTVWYVKWVQR